MKRVPLPVLGSSCRGASDSLCDDLDLVCMPPDVAERHGHTDPQAPTEFPFLQGVADETPQPFGQSVRSHLHSFREVVERDAHDDVVAHLAERARILEDEGEVFRFERHLRGAEAPYPEVADGKLDGVGDPYGHHRAVLDGYTRHDASFYVGRKKQKALFTQHK